MSWIGVAVGVGTAAYGARQARSAARTQQSAANDANRLQWDMFQQSRADSEPWRRAGGRGLDALMWGLGLSDRSAAQQQSPSGAAPPVAGQNSLRPRAQDVYLQPDGRYRVGPGRQALIANGQGGDQMVSAARVPMRSDFVDDGSGGMKTGTIAQGGDMVTGRPVSSSGPSGPQFVAEQPNDGYGDLIRDFRMSDYMEDPGYRFRLQQGEDAINRNALARGRYSGGSVLRALQDYNSGLASQEFQGAFNRFRGQQADRYNRYASLAGLGQTQVNMDNQQRTAAGAQIGGNIIGAGNAAAAGRIGAANAYMGAANNAMNWYQGQQMINALRNNRDG